MDRGKNIIQEESASFSSYPMMSNYEHGIQQPFPAFTPPFDAAPSTSIPHMDWNPATMLDNLTFIEEKIRHTKNVIRSMVGNGVQLSAEPGELMQQQQQVNADLTCLIVQLISTAGSLLPSLQNSSFLSHPPAGQMANFAGTSSSLDLNAAAISEDRQEELGSPDYEEFFKGLTDGAVEGIEVENVTVKDQDVRDSNEGGEAGMDGDSLPPVSYELLQLEKDEILALHTHFCAICGKGFKRDANLRMHMRGHGDEYKSHAALAKPPRDASSVEQDAVVKRYSCPVAGCRRNKLHRSFLPLKTIMCVKNHYKRSHCEKSHTCSRCHAKKFSIMADLKTHEKHCGQVKWLCSCGTSFTRKDKLFSHVGLFKGHTPSLPADEPEAAADQAARAGGHQEPAAKVAISRGGGFMWGNNGVEQLGINVFESCSDDLLPRTNFGSFDFGLGQVSGSPEYHSEGSFQMLPPDHDQSAENIGES